ncbi:MAG: hypothetical protein H0X39_00045 [Actinobacteria bacterium]|nr:hypothetical protein [Actinomycetota bacterium]
MTETTKGTVAAQANATAPNHPTDPAKTTSAAAPRRKTPLDPKQPAKLSPKENAEAKHTHEERKETPAKLGKGSALVAFRGGARDGTTSTLASHDLLYVVDDAGDMYVRKDEQEGDFRVYQYTTADGEPHPVTIINGPERTGTLERDLAELAAAVKKNPKVKGVG